MGKFSDRWDNQKIPISDKAKQMVIIFGLASFLAGFSVGAAVFFELVNPW